VCASAFIVGSSAGYTMFRGSVKGPGYPLHSPISPSLPLPCVTVCHHISTINFFKEEIDSKYRLCKQREETVDHLTSGCPALAKNGYLMRHDRVCVHLHYSISKALGIKTTDKLYTHTHTHTHPNQYVNKMIRCYGIRGYTQRDKFSK